MSSQGHVQIDGVWYPIAVKNWTRSLLSPVNPKVSQGSPGYEDFSRWGYVVQSSWSGGAGKKHWDGSGYAMSDMAAWSDSAGLQFVRFGEMRPAYVSMYNEADWLTSIGPSSDYQEICVEVSERDTGGIGTTDTECVEVEFWIMGDGRTHVIDVSLYSSTAGSGFSKVRTGDEITSRQVLVRPVSGVTRCSVTMYDEARLPLSEGGGVAVSIVPQDDVKFIRGVEPFHAQRVNLLPLGLEGSALSDWVEYPSLIFDSMRYMVVATKNRPVSSDCSGLYAKDLFFIKDFSSLNQLLYWSSSDDKYTYVANHGWQVSAKGIGTTATTATDTFPLETYSAPPTDATFDSRYVWVAHGDSIGVTKIDTTGPSASTASYSADYIKIGGGFLWRSLGSSVYYSADETTWTEVAVDSEVMGIEFYGDFLYYVTKGSLGRIGYGDAPLTSVRFSSASSSFGGITSWRSSLYYAVDGEVMEFTGSTVRPLLANMPHLSGALGSLRVTGLFGDNHFLWIMATLDKLHGYEDAEGDLVVLRYDGASVFTTAYVPGGHTGHTAADAGYIVSGKIWEVSDPGHAGYWSAEESNGNGRIGSIVTSWMDAGLAATAKDWDSIGVYSPELDGNPATGVAAWVRYSPGDAWSYIGSSVFGSDIRIPDSIRQTSKGIQFLLTMTVSSSLDDGDQPIGYSEPSIKAIVTRSTAAVLDRWTWSVTLSVHDYQEMPDGSASHLTAAQAKRNLENAFRSGLPFEYTDIDGSEYVVGGKSFNTGLATSTKTSSGENENVYVFTAVFDEIDDEEIPTVNTNIVKYSESTYLNYNWPEPSASGGV